VSRSAGCSPHLPRAERGSPEKWLPDQARRAGATGPGAGRRTAVVCCRPRRRIAPPRGWNRSMWSPAVRFDVLPWPVIRLAIPLAIRSLRRSLPGCDRLDDGPDPTCGDAPRKHQPDRCWLTTDLAVGGSNPSRRAKSAGQRPKRPARGPSAARPARARHGPTSLHRSLHN
jgi:hypothetical protein